MEGIKIKKVITAVGNKILNNQLKKIKNIKIISDDIQYQEGIFDVLELKNNVDYLIVKQSLPGEYLFEDLIEKINQEYSEIKIIILLEKYESKIAGILKQCGVYRILNYQKNNVNEIINIINEEEKMEKYNKEIEQEIIELRKCIINNNFENKKEKDNKKSKKFKANLINKYINYLYIYFQKMIKKISIKCKKIIKKIKKSQKKKIIIKIKIFIN